MVFVFEVILFTLDSKRDILCKPDPGFRLCAFTMNLAGTVLMTLQP